MTSTSKSISKSSMSLANGRLAKNVFTRAINLAEEKFNELAEPDIDYD